MVGSPTHLKTYARQTGSFRQGSGWTYKQFKTNQHPVNFWRNTPQTLNLKSHVLSETFLFSISSGLLFLQFPPLLHFLTGGKWLSKHCPILQSWYQKLGNGTKDVEISISIHQRLEIAELQKSPDLPLFEAQWTFRKKHLARHAWVFCRTLRWDKEAWYDVQQNTVNLVGGWTNPSEKYAKIKMGEATS